MTKETTTTPSSAQIDWNIIDLSLEELEEYCGPGLPASVSIKETNKIIDYLEKNRKEIK